MPEILLDGSWNYVGISLEREGWCSTATVGISLSYEIKVSDRQEDLATQRMEHLHTNNSAPQPDVLKGLLIPSGVRRLKIGKGREVNS